MTTQELIYDDEFNITSYKEYVDGTLVLEIDYHNNYEYYSTPTSETFECNGLKLNFSKNENLGKEGMFFYSFCDETNNGYKEYTERNTKYFDDRVQFWDSIITSVFNDKGLNVPTNQTESILTKTILLKVDDTGINIR